MPKKAIAWYKGYKLYPLLLTIMTLSGYRAKPGALMQACDRSLLMDAFLPPVRHEFDYTELGSTDRGLSAMHTNPITISGYVVAVPRNADAHQAIVAIIQDEIEYRVLPRGAGVDLADEVNVQVEATGLVEEKDGINYVTVRGYKVLEDDSWMEEN